MRKKAIRILLWICVLLVFFPASADADVGSTTDGAADPATLYVAGNPDGYPVECFDGDSGTYVGAAPAFLQLVSERTGLDFVYIRAGEQDRREKLARNQQVDLLFALSGETELLDLGDEVIKLFSVMDDGVPTDVYCVLTAISGAEDRAQIRSVAESLTADELSLLMTAGSAYFPGAQRYNTALILLGCALVLALAGVAVLLVLFYRKKHKASAFVDTATKIGNKQYFIRTFRSMISDPARELYYVIHFCFDIGWVNNSYGAEEADSILRYAADTIKQRMKDNEFCARIGGGAFAAAIYSSGADQVENRVDEILRVLNAYSGKYKNGEMKLLFQAGICALALDDKNADKVLYNAEQAYRRAVQEKSAFVFVNHDVLNEQQARVSIREQASEALKQHAFTPYVQFIVSAKDNRICGGEMLSRWPNRLYGLLNPGTYVPILQDMGLIVDHDLLILEEACMLLQEWEAEGKGWFLTCNLTRTTISDPSLPGKLTSITERYDFPREKLILEVTEDSLEENKESALRNISVLKEKGFHIALDDFSSGFTSISDLYGYAVDLVKLDRQMIIDADQDPHAAALMTEISRLCHELKILVLAEGVETETQLRQVRTSLCDYVQGYYFARPIPLRELDGFLERYRPEALAGSAEPTAENAAGEQSPAAAVRESGEAPGQTVAGEPGPAPAVCVSEEASKQPVSVEPGPAPAVRASEEAPAQAASVEPGPAPAVCVSEETSKQAVSGEPGPAAAACVSADAPRQAACAERCPTIAVCASEEAPKRAGSEEKRAPAPVCRPEELRGPIPEKPAQTSSQPEKGEPNMSLGAEGNNETPQAYPPTLKIQYGPYHMELPGNIDMDSVVVILRAIQDGLTGSGRA